mgnify:FL=1
MEQYEIPPGRYHQTLCYALKHFTAEHIFIRLVGHKGGGMKVAENVLRKKLKLKLCKDGLRIIIDEEERFLFRTTSVKRDTRISGKCWSIAFFRIDEQGRQHYGSTGYPNSVDPYTGPDDPRLPKVKQTIFRAVNRDHFVEITFLGKIPIRCLNKLVFNTPCWYYWEIDQTR